MRRDVLSRSVRDLVAPLLAYALLVVWLTWPLAVHLDTHVPDTEGPCRFDVPLIMWALAWQSHALTTAPTTWPDANIYHPAPHALFYGEAGFGALPYFLPVFVATRNPTLAVNLMLLSGVVLTACALHVVARRWTGSVAAGTVAGVTYLSTRWVLWTVSTPSYAILLYFPFLIDASIAPTGGRRRRIALAALVVLQCATSVYVAASVMAPLGLLAALSLMRRRSRDAGRERAAALAIAAPFVVLLYSGFAIVRLENPAMSEQTLWRMSEPFPALLPWGPLLPFAPTGIPLPAIALIALGVIVHLWTKRTTTRSLWLHAGFWAGVSLLASLPPNAVWGQDFVTLPHALPARWLGLYQILRLPQRLGIAALISLCLLAALAFAECDAAIRRQRPAAARSVSLLCACLGAMLLGYWFGWRPPRMEVQPLPAAYPLREIPVSPPGLLDTLGQTRGPLLELPILDFRETYRVPLAHVNAMLRSTAHWRPLLNGYSGYWPQGFVERMRLARLLPDGEALTTLHDETGLATIVVHLAELPEPERRTWLAAGAGGDRLRTIGRYGDDLVLAVAPRRARDLASDDRTAVPGSP